MRPAEALGLCGKDRDLERRMVRVTQTLVRLTGGHFEFGLPKTAKSRRTIPIYPFSSSSRSLPLKDSQ